MVNNVPLYIYVIHFVYLRRVVDLQKLVSVFYLFIISDRTTCDIHLM